MKTAALTLVILAALAAPAAAGPCEDSLGKIDKALQTDGVDPDVKTQVEDMRAQAKQLCDAGNEEEGADILAEATALLGIE